MVTDAAALARAYAFCEQQARTHYENFPVASRLLPARMRPHIAAIYGFEKTAAGHALVMELVAGEDLAQRLRGGPIPIDEALPIARQIADAIADAHERGIVHRDLKPANIKITPEGVFLEQLETDPAHYMPDAGMAHDIEGGAVVPIDLNQPMADILAELSKHPVKTRLSLTGPLVVARDIAHAKIKERLDAGEEMPDYLRNHPVYYAGPAKTPEGMPSGSFGPTTAGRMDSYVEQFQAAGGSMVMLAKGNRSKAVTEACDSHGGFYLGSIGGPAARLAQDCIKKVEVLEYPELGMEAVWKIEVEDFPAFIVVDDKGNDFFADTTGPLLTIGRRP